MRVAVGLLILVVAVPTALLSYLQPFAYWAAIAAALLLVRADPGLRRGALPALAVLAGLVVLAMVGAGVTVGTRAGPIASGGGEAGLRLLNMAGLAVSVAPTATLLALGAEGRPRRLARYAVAACGAILVVDLGARVLVSGMPGLLALLAAYVLVVLALAAHLGPRLRPGPGAAPSRAA